MNETAAIEAIRAATAAGANAQGAAQSPDPAAVAAFSNALGSSAPVGEIPFASQVQQTWRAAEVAYQEHLHRNEALASVISTHGISAAQMSELQYRVATASFQLEMTTIVAKKASDAVSTLVKNG